jgi:hypothetical protein
MTTKPIWVPLTGYSGSLSALLLADGSIILPPAMESTATGRRIRVAGASKTFGNRQRSALFEHYVAGVEEKYGQRVLRALDPVTLNADAAYRDSGRNGEGDVALAWQFRDPNVPDDIAIHLTLKNVSNYYNNGWAVSATISHPRVLQKFDGPTMDATQIVRSDLSWNNANFDQDYIYNTPSFTVLRDLATGNETYNDRIEAWKKMKEMARALNAMEGIPFPVWNGDEPSHVWAPFVQTNYKENEMVDFLTNARKAENLREALDIIAKTIGTNSQTVNVSTKGDVDFLEIYDRISGTRINWSPLTDSIELFQRNQSTDALDAYTNARFQAEIKGQENDFDAYVQAYENTEFLTRYQQHKALLNAAMLESSAEDAAQSSFTVSYK